MSGPRAKTGSVRRNRSVCPLRGSLLVQRPPREALSPTLVKTHNELTGDETQRAAYEASQIRLKVVKRSDKAIKGFIILPKRWIVERTLGWLNRARRLAKDFEALMSSSQAWCMLAIAFLIVRRIARDFERTA